MGRVEGGLLGGRKSHAKAWGSVQQDVLGPAPAIFWTLDTQTQTRVLSVKHRQEKNRHLSSIINHKSSRERKW